MGVEITFVDEGTGIEIIATGVVYGHEIISANEAIVDYQGLPDVQYHLIDKSCCTEYNVTHEEIFRITEFDNIFTQANPLLIVAIIESVYLQYSLSPLWQQIVNKHGLNNKCFKNRDAAIKWIRLQLLEKDREKR